MKLQKALQISLICCTAFATLRAAEQKHRLSDNAALRYYAAFTVMQDSAISDEEARELNGILGGTAPYDDSTYSGLVEKNYTALQLLQLGASHSECDWGLDYQLREEAPVEYVRKALQLGRLNVLYAFHLSITGNKDEAVKTLAAGMRYSRQVANGGSLFATVVAKQLLVEHLRAIEGLAHLEHLTDAQRSLLLKHIVEASTEGPDWGAAITLEFQILAKTNDKVKVEDISSKYVATLKNPASLPQLEATLARSPEQLRNLVPAPRQVVAQKNELEAELGKAAIALR